MSGFFFFFFFFAQGDPNRVSGRHAAQQTVHVGLAVGARTRKARQTRKKVSVAIGTMNLAEISHTLAKAWAVVTMVVELAARHFERTVAHLGNVLPNVTILALQGTHGVALFKVESRVVGLIEAIAQRGRHILLALMTRPRRQDLIQSLVELD